MKNTSADLVTRTSPSLIKTDELIRIITCFALMKQNKEDGRGWIMPWKILIGPIKDILLLLFPPVIGVAQL